MDNGVKLYSVEINNGEDTNDKQFIGDVEFVVATSKFEALVKMVNKMEELELDKYTVEVNEIKELDGYHITLTNKDSVDRIKTLQTSEFKLGDAEATFYNALGEPKIVKVNSLESASKFFEL